MAWEKWLYEGREMRCGRAWRDGDGRLHYYGRKGRHGGRARRKEWKAAEELRRFRADPAGYRGRREAERTERGEERAGLHRREGRLRAHGPFPARTYYSAIGSANGTSR